MAGHLVHFLGGAAMAYFFRRGARICDRQLGQMTPLGRDLLAFGLACTVALFWEFAEFLSDAFLHTSTQPGVANVLRDLALGAAGALACIGVAALVRTRTARRSPE